MVFFDLDGTLLDHKNSEYLGVKSFYNEYKYENLLNEEDFYKLWCQVSNKYYHKYLIGEITFSQQRIERIKEIFSFSDIKLSDEDANRRSEIYLSRYKENWKPFNDVLSCLKEMTGHKLGIISNGDLEQQSLKLEKLRIKDYFEVIVTSGEVGIAKPNVKLFEIACSKINELPKNCYYVGDDIDTDILPCREIGMHAIWLNRSNEQIDLSDIIMIDTLKKLKGILS